MILMTVTKNVVLARSKKVVRYNAKAAAVAAAKEAAAAAMTYAHWNTKVCEGMRDSRFFC